MEEVPLTTRMDEILTAILTEAKGEGNVDKLMKKYPELEQLFKEKEFENRLRDRISAEFNDDPTSVSTELNGRQCGSVSIKDVKTRDDGKLDRFAIEMQGCIPFVHEEYRLKLASGLSSLKADEFFALVNAFWMHFRHSDYCKRRYGEPPLENPELNEFEAVYLEFEALAKHFCDLDTPEHFGLGLELWIYHVSSNRVLIVHRDYQDEVYKFSRYTRVVDPMMRLVMSGIVDPTHSSIFTFVFAHPSMLPPLVDPIQ